MKIAVYHPWVYLRGGIERTLLQVLELSRHDVTVYTHHFGAESTFPELRDHRVIELEPRISVERRLAPLVRAWSALARCRIPLNGESALLVSSDGMGDIVARNTPVPCAVYCHTPLKILHDPRTHQRLREGAPRQWWALRLLGPALMSVDRRSWRRFDHAFVNGGEVQRRVERARLVPSGEVEVLHPGVDTERYRPAERPHDVFVVAGRIMWQKNVELAIDAFRLARARGLRSHMVVAGAVDRKSEAYFESLRRRAADLPVQFERDPSDDRLVDLYQRAIAVVFPPPNEDWGIVPLEAMATGAPVIAVDAGGPRETVRAGETGWLAPPEPEAFAEKMLHAERTDLTAMREAATERARNFSWEAFVERLDEVMEALGSGRPVPKRAQRVEEQSGRVAPRP